MAAGGGASTAAAVNAILVGLGCYLLLLARPSHQVSTLLQGERLGGQEQYQALTSENGKFRLEFNYAPLVGVGVFVRDIYLGIWYNYAGGSVVWIANRNTQLVNPSYGTLTIDGNGSFRILRTGEGRPIIIYENDSARKDSNNASYNTSATLEDSGNLVFYTLNPDGSRKQVLWQSFDYPTDTFLPGMKIGIDRRTGRNRSLTSARSNYSPASGSFTLGMDPDVATQLAIWQRGRVVWRSGVWKDGKFADLGKGSSLNSVYNFSYVANENETYFHYSLRDGSASLFPKLTLDGNGSIRGFDYGNLEVACDQPNLFGNAVRMGCVPFEVPECRNRSDRFTYGFVPHEGFMSSDGFRYSEAENLTLQDCKGMCINNCSCAAYASVDRVYNTGCEIWNSTFSFTPSVGDAGFVFFEDQDRDQAKEWWLWVTLAVGLAIITPSFVGFCYMLWFKFRHRDDRKINLKSLFGIMEESALRKTSNGTAEKQQEDENELQMFNFETIAAATNYFSATNKLGQGGFGPVYKGRLVNGREIAVKRLSRSSGQGFVEFRNEAMLIAKLQHTNLVRLLGLCVLGDEQILVYEYMPNNSLDFILFDSERKIVLDWKKRFNIIEGIAQGLLYLHKYSRLRVIHRDLKASNVLLDDDMNPKISDFGMARILCLVESEANTKRVVGTYGYMSPEYAMHGVVSTKIDVFSFGVLLLEILSGRKNNGFYHPEQPVTLIGYAWQLWKEGQGLQLLDQTLADFSTQNVLRCVHIGLLCVQDQAADRPTMSDVLAMLSNETLELPDPKQPAFFVSAMEEEVDGIEIDEHNCSKNTITISVMEAR